LKQEITDRIVTNSGRSMMMISDIMDISALKQGKKVLKCCNASLRMLVLEIILSTEEMAKEKGIELINNTIEFEEDVFCDQNRIFQVLQNLLTNAIKFCSSGDTIRVEVERKGKNAKVSVIDTGVGMDKQKTDLIFNHSSMTSSVGTAGEKGTGFGLPLVKQIMEMHGSRIKVASEVGVGTTFSFELAISEYDLSPE